MSNIQLSLNVSRPPLVNIILALLETQTWRCLEWQKYKLQQEPLEYQEVIMVAQLWLRQRLPSRNQQEVQ